MLPPAGGVVSAGGAVVPDGEGAPPPEGVVSLGAGVVGVVVLAGGGVVDGALSVPGAAGAAGVTCCGLLHAAANKHVVNASVVKIPIFI